MSSTPEAAGQKAVMVASRVTPSRFPRNRRDLYQLLGLYDPSLGLEALLSRLDSQNTRPLDVYRAVHERAPGSIDEAHVPAYDAHRHLSEAILSQEFRANTVAKFVAAFPELRRDIFIHVPRCAGTDFILNLTPTRLSICRLLDPQSSLSDEEWLTALSEVAREAPRSQDVVVHGHYELGEYISNCGVRSGDSIFSIIRDPLEILISQANSAISRLLQDPEAHAGDTREILECLGVDKLPKHLSTGDLKDLALQALSDRRIVHPNLICLHLGKESSARYEVAMKLVVTNDVEIATTATYSRWLKERWAIASDTHHRRSSRFITRRDVLACCSGKFEGAIAEDQRFYDLITWALDRTGEASIRGSTLAEMLGHGLLRFQPYIHPTTERSGASTAPVATPVNMLVAEDARSTDLCLTPVPKLAAQGLPRRVVEISFGASGNAGRFTRHGWSDPEDHFTWTSGLESRLSIPRPDVAGDYVLRMRVGPFVNDPSLATQRMTLAANGTPVGHAKLRDKAVLECDLDWSLIGAESSIDLLFSLPDASKPSSFQSTTDQRELAMAFEWLHLLSYQLTSDTDREAAVLPARPEIDSIQLAELMKCFESIGENCEFGLVQRRCGAEPLGLLRFSSSPLPKLLKALEARFQGMATPDNIEIQLATGGNEYMIHDLKFGFHYHAWVMVGEQSPEAIHKRECRRVPFLIDKFISDLSCAEKIFVYHGMSSLSLAEALDLHAAIQKYGQGTLMWVEKADPEHPAGTVDWIVRGLLKAYVDRFAPGENAHDLSLESWVGVCRTAYGMHLSKALSTQRVA